MNQDIALYFFLAFNSITSFGTLATVFYLLRKQRVGDAKESTQDNLEENLNSRLRDLQMRQFSLKMPHYRIPPHVLKNSSNEEKKQ